MTINLRDSIKQDLNIDEKVDKIEGKGLSTNDFTDPLKTKLEGLQSSHFRGTFVDLDALQAGVDAPVAGDYADVDGGAGRVVERYIYDSNDTSWVQQGAGGGEVLNTSTINTLTRVGTYYLDYSQGSFDVTLPTSLSIGDEYKFMVLRGDVEAMVTKPRIIRSSHNINGLGNDLDINVNYSRFTMVYSGDITYGIILKED